MSIESIPVVDNIPFNLPKALGHPLAEKRTTEQWKNEGNRFFNAGQFADAINCYTQGIAVLSLSQTQNEEEEQGKKKRDEKRTTPKSKGKQRAGEPSNRVRSVLHTNRGTARLCLEQFEEAIVDFTEALRCDPRYTKACLRRAEAREKLQRYEEALPDFIVADDGSREMGEKIREVRQFVVQRGNCLVLGAIPQSSSDWIKVAKSLEEGGRTTAFIHDRGFSRLECLVKALELNRMNQVAWCDLGEALNDKSQGLIIVGGESCTAIQCFQHCLEIDPTYCMGWLTLSSCVVHPGLVEIRGLHYTQFQCLARSIELNVKSALQWSTATSIMQLPGSDARKVLEVDGQQYTLRQCAMRALQLDHNLANSWIALSRTFKHKGEAIEVHGQSYTRLQCLAKAVECSPARSGAWEKVAFALEPDETVQILGHARTNVYCYIRELEIRSENAVSWTELACALKEHEIITVCGEPHSRLQCLARAVHANPHRVDSWNTFGRSLSNCRIIYSMGRSENCKNYLELTDFKGRGKLPARVLHYRGESFTAVYCFCRSLEVDPQQADIWTNLGAALLMQSSEPTTVVVSGVSYAVQGCLLRALELQPQLAGAWCCLAGALGDRNSCSFNGAECNRNVCFSNAVRFEPLNPCLWFGISLFLGTYEEVEVEGQRYNRWACLSRAVEMDMENASLWILASTLLSPNQSLLVKGERYSQFQCYVRAIELQPQSSCAWSLVAALETFIEPAVISGELRSRTDCIVKALEMAPQEASAWNNAGLDMFETNGMKCITYGGQTYTAEKCFLRSLELDPLDPYVWFNLSRLLLSSSTEEPCNISSSPRSIEFGGRQYSAVQCLQRFLELDEECAEVWACLSGCLLRGESVEINGRLYTQRQCLFRALQFDSKNATAWNALGTSLSTTECVEINGQKYTRFQCYERALALSALSGPEAATDTRHADDVEELPPLSSKAAVNTNVSERCETKSSRPRKMERSRHQY